MVCAMIAWPWFTIKQKSAMGRLTYTNFCIFYARAPKKKVFVSGSGS